MAESARNFVREVRRTDQKPIVPNGFEVNLFASGLAEPRIIRVAPNGDVFVAESSAGRIRVLRPGGSFLAFEIHDGWLQQLIHARSTFVPFVASAANARLNAAGFARASVDFVRGGFLLSAQRI